MRDRLPLDLLDLSEIILLEIRAFLVGFFPVKPLLAGRLTPVLTVINDLNRHIAELLALRPDDLREPILLAFRADIDRLGLAVGGLGLIDAAVVERDLRQAARALEDLAVDGVSGGGLAAATVAAGLVEPVDLGLDLSSDALKGRAERVRIDRRAMVLGDEGRRGAAVDGDGFPPIQEHGQGRPARAAEWIEHDVAGLGVVPDVLPDGGVRLLRPVDVHIVNRRRLGRLDGLVEGRDVVVVGRRIVGRGPGLDEGTQVGVRLVARVGRTTGLGWA